MGHCGAWWLKEPIFTSVLGVGVTQFIGEFSCKLDVKGRFSFPSALRRQLPTEADSRFVINRGFEKCLILNPKNEWNKLVQKVSQLNQFDPKTRAFIRQFYRGATELELDGSGRLNLPNGLMEYAGIGKELILFAHTNKIEVWSKENYESMLNDDNIDFAELGQLVMGDPTQ